MRQKLMEMKLEKELESTTNDGTHFKVNDLTVWGHYIVECPL